MAKIAWAKVAMESVPVSLIGIGIMIATVFLILGIGTGDMEEAVATVDFDSLKCGNNLNYRKSGFRGKRRLQVEKECSYDAMFVHLGRKYVAHIRDDRNFDPAEKTIVVKFNKDDPTLAYKKVSPNWVSTVFSVLIGLSYGLLVFLKGADSFAGALRGNEEFVVWPAVRY